MIIYTARHRRAFEGLRALAAQPLTKRGMIAVGAISGLILGSLTALSFIF